MSDEDRTHLRSGEHDDEAPGVTPRKNKASRCLCVSGSIFFVLLLVAAVVVLALLLVTVGHQPARVLTACGTVEGQFDAVNKVFSFKGIPFAAPPTGHRRWQATEALSNTTCWKGVYYANKVKSMCVQAGNKGSEDCLYLNIYTPTVDPASPLPVMVYIHGGYLQFGDGATAGYSPDERLTNDLKMVFVSIQYRLNAFGFLVSSALPGRHGNYGFLDQIEALRWVKENIVAFGGDPNQVTIFGQSSGGTSVWALMMSPLAKGLFQRAWMISPSAVLNKTLEEAVVENEWFLKKEQITKACGENVTEECLMGINARDIVDAMNPEWNITSDANGLPDKGYFEPALAVIDGHVIPGDPFEMWDNLNSSLYSDVPVMIGSTAQEIDLSPAPGRDLKTWTKYELTNHVARHLDDFGNNITDMSLAYYPWQNDAEFVYTTMTSDLRCVCSVDILAQKASEALRSKVYRYIVTSYPSKPVEAFGIPFEAKYAFHSWDSFAFFWGFDQLFHHGPARSDTDFGEVVQNQMAHFAMTGVPKDSNWPRYPNKTALLSDTITYVDHYHKDECDFWMNNGFFSYSWIN